MINKELKLYIEKEMEKVDMRIKEYYLEDIINGYEEMFNSKCIYDDDRGVYQLKLIGLEVKCWNRKIEVMDNIDESNILNLVKFLTKIDGYKFEENEKE